MNDRETALVLALGHRVRRLRRERGLTLAALATDSGLSARFLGDVEAGRANISVVRLHRLGVALGTTASALLEESGPPTVALLGLRGAGKSTVGRGLADRLGIPFHELDALVEQRAGLPLAELFAVHGESFYRRLEGQALEDVLSRGKPTVLATGGGLVTVPETYDRLKRHCFTVWLRARPRDHMDRVVAQGDLRPMAERSDAMAELEQILEARTPLYAEADVIVDTAGIEPSRAVDLVQVAMASVGHAA